VVTIPNKRVAESIITNYDLPEPRMAVLIRVGVDYVEEATQAVGTVPGLLAEPAPTARLIPGFGDISLEFTLSCQVRSFTDQSSMSSESASYGACGPGDPDPRENLRTSSRQRRPQPLERQGQASGRNRGVRWTTHLLYSI
jgi:hypothetical protein